jgi:FtsH ternary system domain X6
MSITTDIDEVEDDFDETPKVSASEAEIISMARALTAPQQLDVWSLLAGSRTLPPKIGTTCAGLVADALAQIWPALWTRDGARPGASIRNGKVVRGRGWERNPMSPLEYSPFTIALLRWLVEMPLATAGVVDKLGIKPTTIGDQVVAYLALEVASETPAQLTIARASRAASAPLAWLGFAHVLPGEPPEDDKAWDALTTGTGAVVVETLQVELAKRWRTIELTKRGMTDPEALIALGQAQDTTLQRFMAACTRAGRRDLAGFVLDAMVPLLGRDVAPFPNDLDRTKPLGVRMAARNAAGALLRAMQTWCDWDRAHRGVRFLDDDYEASQLLLTRFEPAGSHGANILVASWLAELASLSPTPSPASATIDVPGSKL